MRGNDAEKSGKLGNIVGWVLVGNSHLSAIFWSINYVHIASLYIYIKLFSNLSYLLVMSLQIAYSQ